MAKEYHPDKMADNDDTIFKLINEAFETLSDAKKRREYDSQDPFDDAIPKAESVKTEEDYFSILSSVFKMNAK